MLDDGRLTDNKGRVVNFKNAIIIMTSNLGADIIQHNFENFNDERAASIIETTKLEVLQLLKKTIRPEFLNRIDESIVFTPLSKTEVKKIVEIQLKAVVALAQRNEISLSCSNEVVEYISDKGYDPQFGARPIKRLIQKEVLNQLSKDILAGEIGQGDLVVMDVFQEGIVFRNPLEDEIKKVIEQ